jgi:hypothetical protein
MNRRTATFMCGFAAAPGVVANCEHRRMYDCLVVQTRYLIIASLITALVILAASAVWFVTAVI